MKIHFKGTPIPGVSIKVTCLDKLMLELISCAPGNYATYIKPVRLREIQFGDRNNVIYTFISGATLIATTVKNEYEIHHRLLNGADGIEAMSELNMLEALRKAKGYYWEMKQACIIPDYTFITFRVAPLEHEKILLGDYLAELNGKIVF